MNYAQLPSQSQPAPVNYDTGRDPIIPSTKPGRHLWHHFQNHGKDTREYLRPFLPYLFENTHPEKFMNCLYAIEGITNYQREEARQKSTFKCTEYLYDIISARNAIDQCIVALEKSGNHHVILQLILRDSCCNNNCSFFIPAKRTVSRNKETRRLLPLIYTDATSTQTTCSKYAATAAMVIVGTVAVIMFVGIFVYPFVYTAHIATTGRKKQKSLEYAIRPSLKNQAKGSSRIHSQLANQKLSQRHMTSPEDPESTLKAENAELSANSATTFETRHKEDQLFSYAPLARRENLDSLNQFNVAINTLRSPVENLGITVDENQIGNESHRTLPDDPVTTTVTNDPENSVTNFEARNEEFAFVSSASILQKEELDGLNHLHVYSSTLTYPTENPGITVGENQIGSESKTILPKDSVTTTQVYNPISTTKGNNPDIFETRKKNITISSNLIVIVNGTKLHLNKKFNRTTDVTINYGWGKDWSIANPDSVHSLIFFGSFDLFSVQYFIDECRDMESLELFGSKELCYQDLDDYNPTPKERYPSHLQSIKLSSIGFPFENLYKILINRLKVNEILEFVLKNVSIQYEDIDLFRKFLSVHQETLKILHFENVTLCRSEDCALFDDLKFPNLKQAKLNFFQGDLISSKKSLANLNLAAENMQEFESNVQCLEEERKFFIQNWRKLESPHDFCHVIRN